jgi:hypothetical protein
MRGNIPVFKVRDLMNDPIQGTFYRYELQTIQKLEDVLYHIEKVLKKRKGQETEVLVKWQGWPKKFNSWLPESSVQDYK